MLSVLTCSGPMEDNPDVGTEVAEVILICPVIWFILFILLVLVTMDTLMFMLLLYMLVFACCPKCGGDCCENMLQDKVHTSMSESIIKLEIIWVPNSGRCQQNQLLCLSIHMDSIWAVQSWFVDWHNCVASNASFELLYHDFDLEGNRKLSLLPLVIQPQWVYLYLHHLKWQQRSEQPGTQLAAQDRVRIQHKCWIWALPPTLCLPKSWNASCPPSPNPCRNEG